jgi:hypothetical protein
MACRVGRGAGGGRLVAPVEGDAWFLFVLRTARAVRSSSAGRRRRGLAFKPARILPTGRVGAVQLRDGDVGVGLGERDGGCGVLDPAREAIDQRGGALDRGIGVRSLHPTR